VGLSAVISYLVSQILFSVLIMDKMSRITEKIATGEIKETQNLPWLQNFIYLVKQEIPRATIPVLLTLFLTLAGWLTPFGPIVTIIATGLAMVFLAWDNTDLTPARRMVEFKKRFNLMSSALLFHLGFGILVERLIVPFRFRNSFFNSGAQHSFSFLCTRGCYLVLY
jgi:CysZ protein